MKKLVLVSFFSLLTTSAPLARSSPNFEYLCVQPGDEIHVTIPHVILDNRVSGLKDEYTGPDLFSRDSRDMSVFSFSPIPGLLIQVRADDFENEVQFMGARFLRDGNNLYTWIKIVGGTTSGVAHKIKATILKDGRQLATRTPITIDVRRNLNYCN